MIISISSSQNSCKADIYVHVTVTVYVSLGLAAGVSNRSGTLQVDRFHVSTTQTLKP